MQDRIKVVIVDDEPQSIHRLQDDLATLEDFEVIATSSSAVSAKNLVMSIQPDVLFIDVEMPGQTGFEVLQSLRDEIPMELIVVFSSSSMPRPITFRLLTMKGSRYFLFSICWMAAFFPPLFFSFSSIT